MQRGRIFVAKRDLCRLSLTLILEVTDNFLGDSVWFNCRQFAPYQPDIQALPEDHDLCSRLDAGAFQGESLKYVIPRSFQD